MRDFGIYAALFFVLVLIQVLICNHISLFNVAVPIVFIYFIIRLPIDMGVSKLLTLSFLIGLTVDLFSDTPGVNALDCTLLAAIKKPLLYAYVQKDDRTLHIYPSISTMGLSAYSKYILTFTAIYMVLMFSIEYFNLAYVKDIVIMSAASTVLSFILILGIDSLIVPKPIANRN